MADQTDDPRAEGRVVEEGSADADDSRADQPAGAGQESPRADDGTDIDALKVRLGERTADLQRLQAEYLNYKRRVDRDRELVRENAVFSALGPITDVLDTIDRAREHGPLEPGLRAVAEQLERSVASTGVVRFGAVGDPFDPQLHDALSHMGEDAEVDVPTCRVIARAGYRIGDRVLRPAQVLVVDPVRRPAESPSGEPAGGDDADAVPDQSIPDGDPSHEDPSHGASEAGQAADQSGQDAGHDAGPESENQSGHPRGRHAAYPADE